VQDVADRMGIGGGGRILKTGNMEELRAHFGVAREIQIAYTHQPSDFSFLEQLPGVNRLRQRAEQAWSLELSKEADVDGLVHHAIMGSMKLGGQIRSIGEVAPSLDELYKRFTESSVPPIAPKS
jgi:ABC-type uncharacterized transport system ATPase subunit